MSVRLFYDVRYISQIWYAPWYIVFEIVGELRVCPIHAICGV